MKSRYSAYAVGRCDYILKTTYKPPQNLEQFKEEIASFSKYTTFEKLSILEFLEDEVSFVTFHAKLSSKTQDISFSEKSRFIRKEGRWFYESGTVF
jgi:SEC-C motif-containing protein